MGSNNGARILVNRNNQNRVIEQYPIAISDSKQLDLAEELYQFRANDSELVSTPYLNLQKSDEMCSKSYSGTF